MATQPKDETTSEGEAYRESLRALYHPAYHESKHPPSLTAARRTLPLVFELFSVRSVVDIGCGTGSWLAAAGELGATRLVGVEGEWARAWEHHGVLGREDVTLVLQDLEQPLELEGEFDLAIAVELAEHLSPGRAPSLVADICRLSRRVLFSAATPGQGGFNHINEQWQSWWAERFAVHGFRPLDVIRPRIWHTDDVPYWYRQNILLYLHREELEAVGRRTDARAPLLLDVVHPALLAHKLEQPREEERQARRSPGMRFPTARARALAGRVLAWARRPWIGGRF